MEVIFKGKKYQVKRVERFSFDDIVLINGITGIVDFIGAGKIMIIDEAGAKQFIPVSEIRKVFLLAAFTSTPRSPYMVREIE